jgi:hypothetical protein
MWAGEWVSVLPLNVKVYRGPNIVVRWAYLPAVARTFMVDFDQGTPVKPFDFELNWRSNVPSKDDPEWVDYKAWLKELIDGVSEGAKAV